MSVGLRYEVPQRKERNQYDRQQPATRSPHRGYLAAEDEGNSSGSPPEDVVFPTEGHTGSTITLEHTYRHMAINDPRLAQRAGGRLAYCDNRPSIHAVRNRAGRAVELALPVIGSFLGPVEVACFAGGTGLFASILMHCLNPDRAADVKIRLFNMDPCAVLAAQRRIPGQRLKNVRTTWKKLLSDRESNTNSGFLNSRFVFAECLGMFDSLPDKLTKSDIQSGRALPAYGHALRKLFSTIRQGGMLVVGNFVRSHPDQAYMGPGSWPLILRDEDEMARLVHKFGVLFSSRGDSVTFERVEGADDTQILMLLGKGNQESATN